VLQQKDQRVAEKEMTVLTQRVSPMSASTQSSE
jgi:hypothetical protein